MDTSTCQEQLRKILHEITIEIEQGSCMKDKMKANSTASQSLRAFEQYISQ